MEYIAEINDSVIIADILNRSFLTVALEFNLTVENSPRFPAFIGPGPIEYQLNKGLKMYGYVADNIIAGCAGYSYLKDRVYLIERLATIPEHRHSGIGRKLMEFCEKQIEKAGGKTAGLFFRPAAIGLCYNTGIICLREGA